MVNHCVNKRAYFYFSSGMQNILCYVCYSNLRYMGILLSCKRFRCQFTKFHRSFEIMIIYDTIFMIWFCTKNIINVFTFKFRLSICYMINYLFNNNYIVRTYIISEMNLWFMYFISQSHIHPQSMHYPIQHARLPVPAFQKRGVLLGEEKCRKS